MSNTTYTNDVIKSWDELHRDSRSLAQLLLSKKEWKGIIAVTRGGMIPAAIVARELNIRLIDTLCISCYDEQHIGELRVLKDTMLDTDGDGYLVIDDLVDTGTTLRSVRERLPASHIATLYVKPAGKELVDTSVYEFTQETWLRFPWDLELGYSTPLVNRN
ncbi:xanthine phosphoribosyltransferase [Sansalvadorimonas sp. 2012CJ34-2]|uniref:Xanthine phosphoribosyltransferase n=1 Tax=Parendozoicomonas callyspongiae TaxID=2942213 RepID=A0ABT0PB85_9GAMM|nr:xanthine phosphoribosyltransferase [Sansalvadorimonas sp. 2012CJ34-2]MCL6268506.1 xanthine phosphoribosyltransferase [Sansalvadorimonas sp. 2012CJ34-2]